MDPSFWTKPRAYIIRMSGIQTDALNRAANANAMMKYEAYVAKLKRGTTGL